MGTERLTVMSGESERDGTVKSAIVRATSFGILLAMGQGFVFPAPAEPVRLMLWGFALLNLSSGARIWIKTRRSFDPTESFLLRPRRMPLAISAGPK
jgi:hypothetical protein